MTLSKARSIDLKGEVCPYTFMLTKLSLEEMNVDEILEVTVDYPPAVENIPRSVRDQNLGEVLNVENLSKNIWKLTIKKC